MSRQPLPRNAILGSGVDQYRIDSVLGPGGFGITYLGRSLRLDRDVAIKEYFPAEFAYRDGTTTVHPLSTGGRDFFTTGLRYFIEEARVLGRFRHEHIVRVIGLIEQNGTAYMVLEFEDGVSLKRWLQQLDRAPTQAELDALLEPILSALDTIHGQQLFHRDIAPDNIIIRPNGKPVLIDFGAARQITRENSHTLGAIVKSGYSPPEQYTLDTKLQGAWSDVYALAATLHHALMGYPPEEASKRQLQDSSLPIQDHLAPHLAAHYRPSFLDGLNAGLALKPRDRPATIAKWRSMLFATEPSLQAVSAGRQAPLAHHVDQGRTVGRSDTLREPAGEDQQTHPYIPSSPRALSAGGGSSLASAIQFLALAVAAVGGVGFFWFGGVGHSGSWISAILFLASLAVFIVAGVADFKARNGPSDDARQASADAPNTAATAALALAAFWLPPFVLPTYYLSAALLALAALSWFIPRSQSLAAGLVVICLGHVVLALWLMATQPFGDGGFVLLLEIGLAVVAALSTGAAGMWVRWAGTLRQQGAP